jgi:hypothetical protein
VRCSSESWGDPSRMGPGGHSEESSLRGAPPCAQTAQTAS